MHRTSGDEQISVFQGGIFSFRQNNPFISQWISQIEAQRQVTKEEKKEDKVKKKEDKIIYPLFLEACQYTQDEYWREILKDLAHGKVPYSFVLNGNSLIVKGRKSKSLLLPTNPKDLAEKVIYFLEMEGNLFSQHEAPTPTQKPEIKGPAKSWSEISGQVLKQRALQAFIQRWIRRFSLRETEIQSLQTLIQYGLIQGCFGNDNIVVVEGEVMEIVGLRFDETKRCFYLEPYLIRLIERNRQNKDLTSQNENNLPARFTQEWIKYLSDCYKRKHKHHRVELDDSFVKYDGSGTLSTVSSRAPSTLPPLNIKRI